MFNIFCLIIVVVGRFNFGCDEIEVKMVCCVLEYIENCFV